MFTFMTIDPRCHRFQFGQNVYRRIVRNEMVKRIAFHIHYVFPLCKATSAVFVSDERGVNSKCNQITLPMTWMKRGDINFYNLSVSDLSPLSHQSQSGSIQKIICVCTFAVHHVHHWTGGGLVQLVFPFVSELQSRFVSPEFRCKWTFIVIKF